MKLLLDTHIFVWYILGAPQLPPAIDTAIRDSRNDIFVSVVAIWEASVKYAVGKWPLPQSPEILLPTQRIRHQIISLPIDEECIIEAAKLPLLHKDPFDRILTGQAIRYGLTLVTVDAAIRAYPTAPILTL